MVAQEWKGVGDYDFFLTLDEREMRDLSRYYGVDWSFFTKSPAKSLDGQYFCFVSLSRKAFALLPFLSLAYGGMYNVLPMGNGQKRVTVDYEGKYRRVSGLCGENEIFIRAADFAMEDFRFPARG